MDNARKEPRDGGADVGAVYAAGLSGYYPSPYLTCDDLLALSEMCRTSERVVAFVEAHEITEQYDIARLDLSLYGETDDQKLKPWADRAADSHTFILDLLASARAEANPVMFSVWLDWEDQDNAA